MNCPNCGREIPEEKNFCGYCGHRLVQSEQTAGPEAPRPQHAPPPSAQDSPVQAGDAAVKGQVESESHPASPIGHKAPAVPSDADEIQAAEGVTTTGPSSRGEPAPSEDVRRGVSPAAPEDRPLQREPPEPAAPEAHIHGLGETRGMAKESPLQKSPSTGPAPSRRPPGWLMGIGGLVVLAVAGILIAPRLLGGGQRDLTAPIPTAPQQRSTQPDSAMQEVSDPTPIQHQPSQASAQFGDEAVEVSLLDGEATVGAGQPVTLAIGWTADTHEQVEEFLDVARLTISMDGDLLDAVGEYWGDVEKHEDVDQDGDMDFISHWRYPLGTLPPGAHLIQSSGYLMRKISDGWDDFGPGQWLYLDLVIEVVE